MSIQLCCKFIIFYCKCILNVLNEIQANLAKQAARFQVASKELSGAQAQLDEKQAELDKVQAMYDAAMAEKQVQDY